MNSLLVAPFCSSLANSDLEEEEASLLLLLEESPLINGGSANNSSLNSSLLSSRSSKENSVEKVLPTLPSNAFNSDGDNVPRISTATYLSSNNPPEASFNLCSLLVTSSSSKLSFSSKLSSPSSTSSSSVSTLPSIDCALAATATAPAPTLPPIKSIMASSMANKISAFCLTHSLSIEALLTPDTLEELLRTDDDEGALLFEEEGLFVMISLPNFCSRLSCC